MPLTFDSLILLCLFGSLCFVLFCFCNTPYFLDLEFLSPHQWSFLSLSLYFVLLRILQCIYWSVWWYPICPLGCLYSFHFFFFLFTSSIVWIPLPCHWLCWSFFLTWLSLPLNLSWIFQFSYCTFQFYDLFVTCLYLLCWNYHFVHELFWPTWASSWPLFWKVYQAKHLSLKLASGVLSCSFVWRNRICSFSSFSLSLCVSFCLLKSHLF